jgi:hypothetical protein
MPKKIGYGYHNSKRQRERIELLQTTIQYDTFDHEWNATVSKSLGNRARIF